MSKLQSARFEHLLVDLDGTLLGNKPLQLSLDFSARTLQALKEYGGWRKAVSALLKAQIKTQLKNTDQKTNDAKLREIFAHELDVTPEKADEIVKKLLGDVFPKLKKHFFPMPYAHEFLTWAKTRYKLTLATNPIWPLEIIELRVRWAGFEPTFFEHITHAGIMKSYKPHLEYYQGVLDLLKTDASKCLLIGNDVKMDLPATRAGIPVVIVGPYKKITPFKKKKDRPLAWKASFPLLKQALDDV